jgi:hypothetical protein
MNKEYLSVLSEVNELEQLLSLVSQDDIIDRMSLTARLNTAKEILSKFSGEREIPNANLTFRGKPVVGTYGILADFGAKAVETFSNAFTSVLADFIGRLKDAGPVPGKEKNQLQITGTAVGSFGFELELPRHQIDLFSDDPSEIAMKKIETLFRLSVNGTDDEVAEIIADIHPRAIKSIYEFLNLLVQSEAWCGLEFGNSFFCYADYEQIKISANRLKDDNIHENDESCFGEFQGVLPAARTFEFNVSSQNEVIRGKIDLSIDDPDILNRLWLHKPITVKFHTIQVGTGKLRYTLPSLNSLLGEA